MNSIYFSARFSTSASDPRQCPPAQAEVAFAGRSNAGKSSAINCITRNKKLARTSKTPGRTQLINYFMVDKDRYLVDLPGYGFAQVSKQKKQQWQSAMQRYLLGRDHLKGIVLVMDIRHPLTDMDWQMIDIQHQSSAELHLILTKADKLSRNRELAVIQQVQNSLGEAGVSATLQSFSALKNKGVTDAHAVLDHWLYDKALPCE